MELAERRRICRELMKKHYGNVPEREEVFDQAVSGLLEPSHVLLDAGCGFDFPFLSKYAPKVSFGVGVDLTTPDKTVPGWTRVLIGNLERLPIKSGSVDVIISRSVVEHLDHPTEVFTELGRTLRPGGRLIFTTPNKYYYSCLIALLTPEWIKAAYFRAVFGEDAYHHFPVRYRANTRSRLERLAAQAGLRVVRLDALRHYPYYLMFSPLLFRLGVLYDRIITRLRQDWLQSTWLVVMEKPR